MTKHDLELIGSTASLYGVAAVLGTTGLYLTARSSSAEMNACFSYAELYSTQFPGQLVAEKIRMMHAEVRR